MGVIDWVGAKVVKYGYGFKGVTSKDIKMLRKIFPLDNMEAFDDMTKEDAYDLYLSIATEDLKRIKEIITVNKDKIMKQIKNNDIEFSRSDISRVIDAMGQIIKAKEDGKSRDELEKIVDKLVERFAKTNPKWFNEANFREDIILRF